MTPVIENDDDHEEALKIIEQMMKSDPPKFSPEGDMLECLFSAVMAYEEKRWPI